VLVGCLVVGVCVLLVWPPPFGGAVPWSGTLAEGRSGHGSAVDARNVTVPPGIAAVHDRGVTGTGVAVGVIDVTGFDADRPALAGHVAAARSFDDTAGVANGGANRHGTAVALSVAELAPDASLHLAVAHSAADVEEATAWFLERDVDVVVAPFNSPATPDDGTARVSIALSRLREAGIVVVTSAGNFAQSHWQGRLSPRADGRHRFAEGVRNRVFPAPNGPRWPASAGLWLTWNGSRFPHDLNLELYRSTRDGPELVETSRRIGTGQRRSEYLGTTLPSGDYYLVLDVPERTLPHVDGRLPRIEVTASGVVFDQVRPEGSLTAPATAHGVVAVGAVAPDGDVSEFSSRGPTADGRRGVDVVAPTGSLSGVAGLDAPGTSAAAAYAGATAALVESADPSRSAAVVERRLTTTATGRGRSGPETATGHGRISPTAAVFGDSPGPSGRSEAEASSASTPPPADRTVDSRPPRRTLPTTVTYRTPP
jgi:hypothetical protein